MASIDRITCRTFVKGLVPYRINNNNNIYLACPSRIKVTRRDSLYLLVVSVEDFVNLPATMSSLNCRIRMSFTFEVMLIGRKSFGSSSPSFFGI